MSRQFKAFISYRQLPLDMEVAKKVHRRIEHFTIPKSLRKNGKKRLGYVFRDQEELPLSTNLTRSILDALDSSEFLIVICTPETQKSEWVKREISYFRKTHDDDHVIVVLAEGNPESSFFDELVGIYGENGTIIGRLEPLAANIAAKSNWERNRLFRTESLRILAALIGCSFDELFRREHRYQLRKRSIVLGTALLVSTLFIGMLLDRNEKIQTQLERTQIQESLTLTALSKEEFKNGNYRSAIQNLINALPEERKDRPYVAEAERELANELYLYKQGIFAFSQSIRQAYDIKAVLLSEDCKHILTVDSFEFIRIYDVNSGKQLWETEEDGYVIKASFVSNDSLVLVETEKMQAKIYSVNTGEKVWQTDDVGYIEISPDTEKAIICREFPDYYELQLVDLKTGVITSGLSSFEKEYLLCKTAATFSCDGQFFSDCWSKNSHSNSIIVHVCNISESTMDTVTVDIADNGGYSPLDYDLTFDSDLNLLIAYTNSVLSEQGYLCKLNKNELWQECFTVSYPVDIQTQYVSGKAYISSVKVECTNGGIIIESGKRINCLNHKSGEIEWEKELSSVIIESKNYGNGSIGLVKLDGIDILIDSGVLGSEASYMSYISSFPIENATVQGDRYSTSVFAVVSEKDKGQLSIIKILHNEKLVSVDDDESGIVDNGEVYFSPSGELAAVVLYDYYTPTLLGYLVDLKDNCVINSCTISNFPETFSYNQNEVFLTEEGALIVNGTVIDLENESVYQLCQGEGSGDIIDILSKAAEKCFTYENAFDQSVYTTCCKVIDKKVYLSIWRNTTYQKDAICPESVLSGFFPDRITLLSGGNNGLILIQLQSYVKDNISEDRTLLYSITNDNWYVLDTCLNENSAFCFENNGDRFALQDGEGVVEIIDATKNAKLCRSESQFPQIRKMFFTQDDAKVLLLSCNGQVYVIDSISGQTVSTIVVQNADIFDPDAKYRVLRNQEEGKTLIFYENSMYTESCCISLLEDTWNCTGVFYGLINYNDDSKQFYVKPYNDGLYFADYIDLNCMLDIANAVVQNTKNDEK